MMKIKNSDKEEMQRLCNFVRENLEAFGAFPQNSRYVFDAVSYTHLTLPTIA